MITNISILIFFLLLSAGYITLMFASISDIFARFKEVESGGIISIMKSYSLPPVSIIMPAYNESIIICDSIDSLLNADYLNTQIIIINDGSTDDTLTKLINKYNLLKITAEIEQSVKTSNAVKGYYISQSYNNITVIDKHHTDRCDTLNIGVNACKTPFLITIDADTLIERDAISRLIFYMLSKPDMDAAGGGVYILNGCTLENGKITDAKMPLKPIYAIQACEYLRSFLFSKSGWNLFGGSLCYSGTFTAFKTSTIIKMGGFDIGNLAQDFEIITHIRSNQYEHKLESGVGYTPAAVVWTDVPGTFAEYWHQRFNWQYFSLESLMLHARMLFNPAYGLTGLFIYPFFLFGEILGAVVEFTAYICIIASVLLGVFDLYSAVLLYAFAWGFFTLLTMATALINFNTFNRYRRYRDIFVILIYTIIEGIGFRQFNVTCRVVATFAYFFGKSRQNREIILVN